MVTKKTTSKVVLKEDKADVPVEEPTKVEEKSVVAEKPVEKSVAPKEKHEPIVVDLTNLTLPLLKVVLAKIFARLKIKAGSSDVFSMLSEVGVRLKLEPYERGCGAEYTKDYLKRILEKVNDK